MFRCQHSRNFDEDLTGFKETAGCICPCSQPLSALPSLGILKITCRVLGWQIVTLLLNANLQQTLMKTDIGFVLRYLKQPRVVTVAKTSCSFIHKSMVFGFTPQRSGCLQNPALLYPLLAGCRTQIRAEARFSPSIFLLFQFNVLCEFLKLFQFHFV